MNSGTVVNVIVIQRRWTFQEEETEDVEERKLQEDKENGQEGS